MLDTFVWVTGAVLLGFLCSLGGCAAGARPDPCRAAVVALVAYNRDFDEAMGAYDRPVASRAESEQALRRFTLDVAELEREERRVRTLAAHCLH